MQGVNFERCEIIAGEWLVIQRGFVMVCKGFLVVNGFVDLSNGGFLRVD